MDLRKIIPSFLIFFVLGKDVSSLVLQTEDVVANLQEDNSIILNCTYQKDEKDFISDGGIRWQKQIEGTYRNIAKFSLPGSALEPFIEREMEHSYNNRTELIAPNTPLAAVMIIKDPVCSDEGTYRCLIEYIYDKSTKQKTSSVVVSFNANAREPNEFAVFPNEVIENQSLSLTCSADVGSPRGFVRIWKTAEYANTPEVIYTSNTTNIRTENCTEYINVTTIYTVTREDNGAMFLCSSQNGLTEGTGPSMGSKKITVFYGPSNTKIEPSFSNSRAFVGNYITMKCSSDGNPHPNYTWKFNLTEIVNDAKYNFSANKSRLSFTITNITDSGYYQCVTSIDFKENWFNSSSNITLTVEKRENEVDSSFIQPCSVNTCLLIENCIMKNGRETCSINIWSVIAFPFIALTFILCSMTISLVLSRNKQQKKGILKKGFNIGDVHVSYTRETFEDFGGYADPKDVKRAENGQIKSDKDGRDNPYADPVDFQTQYAVVQKNWETPAKSSNEKNSSNPLNLMNDTDSLNTANPLSPPECTNPKNSTSDEKTPGSTETSETIPKPPNVYDGAWV